MKFVEEIERARINLFSDITHKFRTSLTGIVSVAEDLMANNTKNRTIQRNAMDIISQCNSLLDLVNKTLFIIDIVPGYAIENPGTPVLQPDQMGGADSLPLSVSEKEFITDLTKVMFRHIEEGDVNCNKIASSLCISRIQLNRKIKAITGYTTTEFIQQARISMSKHLLSSTGLKVGEVASKCGFYDMAYFCALFKKCVGKTPNEYRKLQESHIPHN